MDYTNITIIGILTGIFIFGIKTGIGCGFSTVKVKETLAIASSYFLLSIVIGSLIGYVDQSNLEKIASMGMTLHVLMALLLIGVGIYTRKKWNCGHDVSKHTFLFISIPCPVCLTALFISCMMLASTLEFSGLKIGIIVGVVFFVSVMLSSWVFKKMGKSPETLGSVMTFIGLFYLLGAMIVPAYMKTKQTYIPPMTGGAIEPLPLVVFVLFVAGGFLMNRMRGEY